MSGNLTEHARCSCWTVMCPRVCERWVLGAGCGSHPCLKVLLNCRAWFTGCRASVSQSEGKERMHPTACLL